MESGKGGEEEGEKRGKASKAKKEDRLIDTIVASHVINLVRRRRQRSKWPKLLEPRA